MLQGTSNKCWRICKINILCIGWQWWLQGSISCTNLWLCIYIYINSKQWDCLRIDVEESFDLCNSIPLKFEKTTNVSYILVCIWLTSLILIFIFHVYVSWDEFMTSPNVQNCMSLIIVGQFVKNVDPFCTRVDVVPY